MKLPLLTALCSLSLLTLSHAGSPVAGKGYTPPATEGTGAYVSLFGGGNVYQTADLGQRGFSSRDLDSETGWVVGGKAGYVFQNSSRFQPALEAEVSYLHNDFRADGTVREPFAKISVRDSQDVHILPVMLNGLVKFDLGHFRPYLGAGLGFAYLRRNEESRSIDVRFPGGFRLHDQVLLRRHFGHTDDFSFAAQGIAGFEYLCCEHLGLYTEYKALWVKDGEHIENYLNHLVTGGVRLYF